MTSADVLQIAAHLRAAEVRYWISGGWGIDALVGQKTRDHQDLDIAVPVESMPAVMELVDQLGYAVDTDWRPARVAVRDASGRVIDIHPIVFEADGSAWLPDMDGGRFAYPAESLTSGTIGDDSIPCISAELQVVFHRGYPPSDKDRLDMDALVAAGFIDRTPYDDSGVR